MPKALLHNIGISLIGIKPANMMYEEILKILTIRKEIKESVYSPPEVLKKEEIEGQAVDIYCWAMCFYSIIANKEQKKLKKELKKYKLKQKEDYKGFKQSVKDKLKAIKNEQKLNAIEKVLSK